MTTLLRLAIRNIRRNRSRTLLTLSAIGFGVLMTIFLGGVSQGFTNMFSDDSMKSRTGAVQVHRKGYFKLRASNPLDFDFEAGGELEQKIRGVAGVVDVAPRLIFQGLVNGPGATSMIFVAGVDPDQEYKVLTLAARDVMGKPVTAAVPSGAVLGIDLADALGLAERHETLARSYMHVEEATVKPGASATLSAARKGGQQNALDMDVVGVIRGGTPYDSKRTGTVPLAFAQELLGMKGRANEYIVSVRDRDQVQAVKQRLQAALGPEFDVRDWRELRPFVADVVDIVREVLVFVCFIFLLIAVIGVVNTMLMSVMERTREIGTMMAVGVTRRSITLLFLLEGLVLAVIGTTAGVAGGLLIVVSLARSGGFLLSPPGSGAMRYLIPEAPVELVLITLMASLIGSLTAAAYPAWRASQLRPVEALRSI